MDPLLDLADDVPALDLVRDVHGLALVVRPAHRSEGEKDAELGRKVLLDERRVERLVVVGSRADEVHDGHVEHMCAPEPAVEVVVRVGALVAIENTVGRPLVPIPVLLVGAVDRQSGGAALRVGGAVDAERAVEKGNPSSAEAETG